MYRESGPPECSSASTWRLFLGFWPPPPVLAVLQRHADAWAWPPGARRTRPGRMHLTLHFLGAVEPARIPALRALDLRGGHCVLTLDTPRLWHGGIAVLEAAAVPPALAALHARSGQALRALGFAPDDRPWRPHVTLSRKAQGAQPPPAPEPVAWSVEGHCVLARSLPGGQGYVPVATFD